MREPQTIEQTGKIWKAWTAAGAVAGLGGLAMGILAGSSGWLLVAMGGGIAWVIGRIGAWWHHG